MKRLVNITIFTVVIFFCFSGWGALSFSSAQQDVQLASLRVGLWPEYDQSSLLVIYWGELADTVVYPVTLNLRMPARIVAPHVVATQSSLDSSLDETTYEIEEQGDWRVVSFEVNGPRFQFEFYDALRRIDSSRQAAYVWPGDYSVNQLLVELQQPPHSENVVTTPELPVSQVRTEDGLQYYGGEYGPLAAGEALTFEISYSRTEDTLTVDLLNALQSDSGGESETPFTTVSAAPGLAGSEIVLLIAVAVVSFLLGAATMRLAVNMQNRSRKR